MGGPASDYHRLTSYERGSLPAGRLDWSAHPDPWKRYRERPTVDLKAPDAAPGPPLGQLAGFAGLEGRAALSAAALGRLLHAAYGVTALTARGEPFFRAAPSAGGLFPCELYVALPGLAGGPSAGLYHYGSERHGLTLLRAGDLTAGGGPVFFVTAILFRSAWKYRRRAFRYHLLDAGHLGEGLALAAAAEGIDLDVSPDFDDVAISDLLGLDPEREAPLLLARPRQAAPYAVPAVPAPDATLREASQVSPREVAFDEIRAVLEATTTIREPAVAPPWGEPSARADERGGLRGDAAGEAAPQEQLAGDRLGEDGRRASAPDRRPFRAQDASVLDARPSGWSALGLEEGDWIPVDAGAESATMGFHEAARLRRSRRAYGPPGPGDGARLSGLAALLCPPAASGASPALAPWQQAVRLALLVGEGLEGWDAGLWLLDRGLRARSLSRPGDLRAAMAAACLDQGFLVGAAVHVLLLSDLAWLESRFGPRGYRYAMIEAGRVGQRVYLGATALGWGACGIGALYDDEAAALLGLEGDARLLYLLAAGPRSDRGHRPA